MKQNNLELLSVNELLSKKFYIPSYQRGYRWTERQVRDLLEDIKEFNPIQKDNYEFYCLQPLVVKKMSEEEKERQQIKDQHTWYEVIDGQQRLTTIYLILRALSLDSTYELKYSREIGDTFISSIRTDEIDDSTIDHLHMTIAFGEIKKWLAKNEQYVDDLCDKLLKHIPDNSEEKRDKANNVRFIWYESVDENPIDVFTRLNVGKISLTNAELIKALLLSNKNFKEEHVKLRQQEIASEWDRIEYTLQNDEFWLFMHKIGYHRPTRIDFFFDLMCENNSLKLSEETYNEIGFDEDRTFRYFYEYFKSGIYDLNLCWGMVKSDFQTLMDWYENVELYHYIGFLIECGNKNIKTLLDEWEAYSDRKQFVNHLRSDIKQVLDACPGVDFQYKEDGSDKRKAKPILLFHNIQTIVNQNKRQAENEKYQIGVFYKFPFHLYKKENWDVEHINSNTTNPEEDENTRKEWLLNHYLSVPEKIQEEIKTYIENGETEELPFKSIKEKMPLHKEWSQSEKNQLKNYCLLDAGTNRSYGNAIFSAKRRIIISKDKGVLLTIPSLSRSGKDIDWHDWSRERKITSAFVAPCTRNVFLKYYSTVCGDNNYWTPEDAESYVEDIKSTINQLKECDSDSNGVNE